MNPDFRLPLDLTQLVMLGGVIWGLARMSKSVENLGTVTDKLTSRLEYFGGVLQDMVGRVRVLEDRDDRGGGR